MGNFRIQNYCLSLSTICILFLDENGSLGETSEYSDDQSDPDAIIQLSLNENTDDFFRYGWIYSTGNLVPVDASNYSLNNDD